MPGRPTWHRRSGKRHILSRKHGCSQSCYQGRAKEATDVTHRPYLDPSGFFRKIPLLPHQMVDRLTPAEDVIVLCHLGVPQISIDDWSLRIDGLVSRPRLLRFSDLQARRKYSVESVHQCAGSPLAPNEPTRRICNVAWGGARLDEILADCGVQPTLGIFGPKERTTESSMASKSMHTKKIFLSSG
jgi:Oxidoreductase molybdopterin binding domain